MYEHMLRAYLKKQEETRYTQRAGVPLSDSLSHRSGIPVYPDLRQQDPYINQMRPPYVDDSRIARLEDELRKREEQDRRNMEIKIQELSMKLEQSKTYQEDPRIRDLQDELKRQAEASRLLQQQLEQQRTETLQREIQDIKNLALMNRGLTNEQVQQMVDQRVREERSTIDARHELESMLDSKLAARTGTTEADVELKKAEYDLELGKKKIEAESEKMEMIGKTVSDVAGVFGEGLGRGLASKTPPSQQQPSQGMPGQETPSQQTQLVRMCPYGCGTQLLIDPRTPFGECPKCGGKMIIDEAGNISVFQERPVAQPLATQQHNPHNNPEAFDKASASMTIEEPISLEKEPYMPQGQPPKINYTITPDEKKEQTQKKKTEKE
jgi:hypothetical protein